MSAVTLESRNPAENVVCDAHDVPADIARISRVRARAREYTSYIEANVTSVTTSPATAPDEANPPRWIAQEDVITVVEDLADENMRPGRIARPFGLTADEVLTVLRRSGR